MSAENSILSDIISMKRLSLIVISALLFSGCGSSSVSTGSVPTTSDGTSPAQTAKTSQKPSGFTGYTLYEYLVPASVQTVQSYKYQNQNYLRVESLEYNKHDNFISQRSLQNQDGEVEYQNNGDDTILVTLYHDSASDTFKMHNFVNIGDTVTLKQGSCTLSAYYDRLDFQGKSFDDVVQISCAKSVGYYQKGKGLVVENTVQSSLQTNALTEASRLPARKIGNIDSFERTSSRYTALNIDSAIEAQADKLWRAPYNLNGQGMKVGLVDGGAVLDTHVELRNRVHNLTNSDTLLHATHVAGTMISAGSHLYKSHGFANQAELYAMNYAEIYFANSVKKLADDYGVLISNHSYGYDGPEGIGEYDGESKAFDMVIHDNPYIIACVAAGNDGEQYKNDNAYTKWGLIKGGSNAKNVLTVAAIDNESNKIAAFSSRGPIDGGRLKPDIAIDGANVLSTSNYDDTAYARMNGTSMATPAATGTALLLSQRYQQVKGGNIRLDTLKAILFNSAKDIENPGPDYKSGFGAIDALAAVKVIDSMENDTDSLVKLDTIHQGENQRYYINSTGYTNFKMTLAWVDDTDQKCGSCANDMLINDIDTYLVEEKSGKRIYPFTLNEKNPDADAIQSKENHIDPQEQISYRLKPGHYTLHINGRKIASVGQNFTIVSSQPLSTVEKDLHLVPMDEHIHKIYADIK